MQEAVPTTKKPKNLNYTFKKRGFRNLESYQRAVMIALLNARYSLTLLKPRKATVVVSDMPKVKYISNDHETIDIDSFAEEFCKPQYNEQIKQGVPRTTAFRRYEKNRRIFVHNYLFDLCLEEGILFDSKPSRRSQKTYSIERIQNIFQKRKFFTSVEEIIAKGKKINDYLFNKAVEKGVYTLNRNDTTLYSFLYN